MRFASSLLLSGLLVGCSAAPVVVRESPPAALLSPCPAPPPTVGTNAELADYALALKYALQGCNNQLDALREWAKEP